MPLVLEPSWVGRRVSIRRVLDHDPEERPQFGDVVGDLADLGPDRAVVDTRRGLVEVPLDRIAIARLAPPSTADELALEAVAARGLRPAETAEIGGWLLRADHGITRRANSVLPLRQPGLPLPDALHAAHAWYAERGLPLRIHVPVEARRLLDAALGELGWPAEQATHVMAGRLAGLQLPSDRTPPVDLLPEPDDEWLALYGGGRATSEAGRALLVRHDLAAFAVLRLDGRTVAIGRGAVDGDWLGMMAVEVEPAYRRQGLGSAVLAALCSWGAGQGAARGYLQVSAGNAAGIALYENAGFWVHHDYHYRTEPSPEPS